MLLNPESKHIGREPSHACWTASCTCRKIGPTTRSAEKNHIPDEIEFRTKPQIALDEIIRVLANGVRVSAWTFDELYGRDSKFLDGLETHGQTFIAEVPVDFHGWVKEPLVLEEGPKTSKKRAAPRIIREWRVVVRPTRFATC